MSKKVQASDGLVKSAEVKTAPREKPTQKPKAKAAPRSVDDDKTKAAKPKETAKSGTSAKSGKSVDTTKKGKTAAKSEQPENPTSTKKSKTTAKAEQPEPPASMKKAKTGAKSEQSETPASTKKAKTAAKSEQSETPASTRKSKAAAKSEQSENPVSTKKGKTGAKTVEPENPASTKKGKTAVKSVEPENPDQNDDLHEQRKAVRTPQVMKLVETSDDVNPVLLAGKSRVPPQLRGRQSLTRLMRREMGEVFYDVEDTVVVNITELAIEHEAPEILDRFNACSCDKCVEIFSGIISERVPVRFARVRKNGIETGSQELRERVAPMRKIVITEMIKELIVSKKRCFHDDDTKGHL